MQSLTQDTDRLSNTAHPGQEFEDGEEVVSRRWCRGER